eukprot:UN00322
MILKHKQHAFLPQMLLELKLYRLDASFIKYNPSQNFDEKFGCFETLLYF